jgi:enterochelin esterase-like enzyme
MTVSSAPGRLFSFLGCLGALLALAGPAEARSETQPALASSASLSVQTNPTGTVYLNVGCPAVLTTNSRATASGGVAPYTYTWALTSGTNSWVSTPFSDSPIISAIVNWGDNFTETWTVTATDAVGVSGTGSVTVNFSSPSADGVPDAANRVPIKGTITPYILTTTLPVGQTTYPIQVYVPADYPSTSDPLAVIYATDGGPFNNSPISVTWEFSDMVRIIEAQHLRIAVVGIGGGETRNTDYLLPGADSYYTFLTTEVVPFVESRYDFDPTTRTLSGHSYGGMFCGLVFMRERPGTRFFSNYIALDGSFWVNPTENAVMEQTLFAATGGVLPGTTLVLSSASQGNNNPVTLFYQQLLALNFQGLQLTRVPDFNTGHLLMFDEAFAASLQIVSQNLPGAFTPPVITSQPSGATVTAGSGLNLQVIAVGGGLAYQWLKDGATLSGATGASYSVSNATGTNAGSYTVTVKNLVGTATSDPATITVTTPPPAVPTSSGGGEGSGSGGGGAMNPAFFAALALLAFGRWIGRRCS